MKQNKNKDENSPYYVILQINENKYIRKVDSKDRKFEIGRQAVCQIIERPERVNWRDCELGEDEGRRVMEELMKVEI